MEGLVNLFFIASTSSALLIGLRFSRSRPDSLKYFGYGMMANGIAFGIWSIAVITKPDALGGWVTVGVLFFLTGLILFVLTSAVKLDASQRLRTFIGAAVYVVVLVVLRVIYPSHPQFSEEGLFFFNPHGSVKALEIFGLTAALLPATFELSRHVRPREGLIAKVALTTLLIGGILLITSKDEVLLTIDGWAMGLAFVALLVSFVFRPSEAWLSSTGN